jgi:hypothetical protein
MIRGEKTPPAVSATGQKKGIFGRVRAKTGQRSGRLRRSFGQYPGAIGPGVSRGDQCYEPWDEIFCCDSRSDRAIQALSNLYHEFVIDGRRRNKLKKRPK